MSNLDKSDLILRSFKPIINNESKVLILGTMPGAESLRQQQYYAHPRNFFWPFVYGIFNEKPEAHYNKRIDFLKKKNIALWDVYKSCKRKGSLDSNISDEVPNDVAGLLNTYPNIKFVFCNGGTSEKHFRKNVLPDIKRDIFYMRLPSTSPANASISLEQKMQMWLSVRYALENRIRYKSVARTNLGMVTIFSDDDCVTDILLPGSEPQYENFAVFPGNNVAEHARKQVEDYFKGRIRVFDIPFEVQGTPFEIKVYNALLKVPYGSTITYRELAEIAGNRNAARAVGQVLRKNRLPILIPCHRVTGSGGKNIGFMGVRDNPVQDFLLKLESS
ncbi:MAG: DNA-deoxyinosine glycosylase [Clostridiaceae bacterium]|nr:DNA-deoxyinosine glycosylase [Clostridiaceae bacterium]